MSRAPAEFSASLILALTLSAGCSGAVAQSRGRADRPQYLYVWAGAVDSAQSDFLAVIDATPRQPRYGDVIATIPVGAVTNAHHIEMASDRVLLANGFDAGRTFRFDLRDPRKPLLAGELATPATLAHPHSFVRLANGHMLATYQYQADDHGRPGGLAEHDERGNVVRWKSAVDPAVEAFVRPYSLVTVPALDRIVSTGVDMHGTGLSRVVQVWKLSDLTLIKSLLLPDGPRGDEGLQSFEPRLLPDGRTVIVSTLKCGLHRIDGLAGQNPSATLIHTFADQRCDMPAAVGRYWVQTLSTNHAVVSLDLSDPAHPVEVGRVELGSDNRPHWLAIEPGGTRLLLTGYRDLQYRVLMLRIDPASGRLSVDSAFRDEGSTEAGLSFNRGQWPHGA
ncbi:MAG TPA: hypothetical protein VM616_09010, partial [Gammaproteobacteria bacterium]|nr:hypothetical protein [Gammaproteobacteria bacterium]